MHLNPVWAWQYSITLQHAECTCSLSYMRFCWCFALWLYFGFSPASDSVLSLVCSLNLCTYFMFNPCLFCLIISCYYFVSLQSLMSVCLSPSKSLTFQVLFPKCLASLLRFSWFCLSIFLWLWLWLILLCSCLPVYWNLLCILMMIYRLPKINITPITRICIVASLTSWYFIIVFDQKAPALHLRNKFHAPVWHRYLVRCFHRVCLKM